MDDLIVVNRKLDMLDAPIKEGKDPDVVSPCSTTLNPESLERKQALLDVERTLIGFVEVANSLFQVGARVVYFDKFNNKESALSKLVEVYVAKRYSHINFSDDDIEHLIDNIIQVSMIDISKLRLSSHILTQLCQHGHCDPSFQ
ncbi:hypothetical protein GLP21_12195 [Photobacterium carnosum]|uniref:hypothetical protein n=1 Tax=Photobacterium TaxID=657 RepID=UPI00118198AE|nr:MULTISPECIES: hypothetical protein [Photobacterium]MCD9475826.1 hypothetical protein [Photobacterium phosphoreum]MCD9485877.1 hypothetical protein [Photobacterium iliopiscarium]MCD9507688.1 hypothetical protein [Photobacterium phosphoreum]MCD9538191.1 hypothetical protein [Photobacterium carnosum]MCD9542995.1 hypothetical protein [Photobacterium carnosum]